VNVKKFYAAVITTAVLAIMLTNLVFATSIVEESKEQEVVGFIIRDVSSNLINDVYQINANIKYNFSDDVLSAIQNGVPITIVVDMEILQSRRYIWGKLVAELKQRYKLQFHAISEQYIVENVNSGSREIFPTLHSALYILRQIKSLPIIDKKLLQPGKTYRGRAQVRIELESLPVPLRLNAYTTRSWWLGSDWFEWAL